MRCAHSLLDPNTSAVLFQMTVANAIIDLSLFTPSLHDIQSLIFGTGQTQ
jgi:hypothetical protein